ncbi:MAG: hypothetical protein HONBIEJF_01446 [Fimbriimonadaceae bacterium]|nr:hypothetical protein [Fimbriimonadaceae bacterium]
MGTALIVWGGWDGHEPDKVAELFRRMLEAEGFRAEVRNGVDGFLEAESIKGLSLIVPVVTMAEITPDQRDAVLRAVGDRGVGIAGCHGGMCDSFRADTEWQFLTGGQWVAHPGNDGVRYRVNLVRGHEITDGLADFDVETEQYYLHVDPGNHVLATCDFPHPDHPGPHQANPCRMPVLWTKSYGKGRVFYNALGHKANVIEAAEPRELMRRGFLWAAL